MSATLKQLGLDRLSIPERISLVEEIWASIAAESAEMPLTEPESVELERRWAEDEANPSDGIPWEIVKAEALARWKK